MSISFVVEEAGCESCAELVRKALDPLGTVESIEVDGAADASRIRLSGAPSEEQVGAALAEASTGVGHAYRVQPGSWRTG
jgi:copper chaperone CopZ